MRHGVDYPNLKRIERFLECTTASPIRRRPCRCKMLATLAHSKKTCTLLACPGPHRTSFPHLRAQAGEEFPQLSCDAMLPRVYRQRLSDELTRRNLLPKAHPFSHINEMLAMHCKVFVLYRATSRASRKAACKSNCFKGADARTALPCLPPLLHCSATALMLEHIASQRFAGLVFIFISQTLCFTSHAHWDSQSLPRTGKFYMFWQAFHGVTEQKHINFKKQNIMCQRRSPKSHPLQEAERVHTLKKERTRWYPCARQPYMRCTLVAAVANLQTFKVVQFLP